MFKLSDYFNVRMAEAGDEDKSGGGGGDKTPKTFTQDEVDALVAGLKKNNDALIAEKKEAKRIADEAKAKAEADALERSKRDGDLESLEKSLTAKYEKDIAAANERTANRDARILAAERKSAISALSGLLVDESAADILELMVKTEFDGDDVVVKYVDAKGEVITTDADKFKTYLREHKAFQHLLKADTTTSGGGANGSKTNTGGAGGGDEFDQRLRARLKKQGL